MLWTVLAVLATANATANSNGPSLHDQLVAEVVAAYDTSYGGYVLKNGEPVESAVELSFQLGDGNPESVHTLRAIHTLDWTMGLFDSVGGGFVTGAKDADPRDPSFNKMTFPNARRLEVLLDAWRITGDEKWRRVAAHSADYFDRVLLDGRGGFVHGQIGDRQLVPESNGVAIRAWLEYAARTNNVRMRGFAWKSLDRVWDECWTGVPGFVRRTFFGDIDHEPLLVDQVEMGRAFLLAAHLAGRAEDLERARAIADTMLQSYEDAKGGFRSTAMMTRSGTFKNARHKSIENARATRFLGELAMVTGDKRYRDAAKRTIDSFDFRKATWTEAAEWALALRAITVSDLPERVQWKEPDPSRGSRAKR